jgi:transcriptional regulator with XRE-family HTH domain
MSRRSQSCTPEFRAALGARVRSLRKAQGKGLRTLADAVGMSFVALHQIETGKSEPSATTLRLLSDGLHCSIDWLVRGVA